MIAWKDIFKPRYALVVTTVSVPIFSAIPAESIYQLRTVPTIIEKPYKRDLSLPFNKFYAKLAVEGKMLIIGHYWVLRLLYKMEATAPHNIDKPIKLR